MYRITNSTSIIRLADSAFIPADPLNRDYAEYLEWVAAGNEPLPVPAQPVPKQRELDELRYKKRSEVKDQLIAWMAADNMSRVRSGVWSAADLTSLLSDPLVAEALSYMQSLSYEIVVAKLQQATHPLLTPEIKSAWIAKLQEHFYLVP